MRGVLLLMIAACGGGGGSDADGHYLHWDVDGTHYEGSLLAAASVNGADFGGQGQDQDGNSVALAIIDIATGTFPVGDHASIQISDATGVWAAGTSGGDGMIVITTFADHEIAGTFAGTVQMTSPGGSGGDRSVTNGEFDLSY